MQNISEYDFYVANIVRSKSQRLFGALLRLICIKVGIRQSKLTAESKAYVAHLTENGIILPNEKVDVSPSSLSKACTGSIVPSIAQVTIWLTVIKEIYNSPGTASTAKFLRVETPIFGKDLETDMYRLAQKGSVGEIVDAYERRLPLIKELPPKYCNDLVYPDPERQSLTVRNTDQMPALSSAQRLPAYELI